MYIDGERLKKTRIEKNMTQTNLANKAYISKFVISNIERQVTKSAELSVINLLSFALLVTVDYLNGTSNDPMRNKDGLIQPIYIGPEWDYINDIGNVLALYNNDKSIERLLRDIVFYFSQSKEDNISETRKYGIKLLRIVVDFLEDDNNNSNLSLLLKVVEAFKDNANNITNIE